MVENTSNSFPTPRSWPFKASSGSTLYLWGGEGDSEPETAFVYDIRYETWTNHVTRGDNPPPGLWNGACTLAGKYFFLYGGFEGYTYSDKLYQLNTDNWIWKKLGESCAGGPVKKSGCEMIAYKDQLLLFGGFYGWLKEPKSKQPGSRYEVGITDELHCYGLSMDLWSSPSVKGSKPTPGFGFSLTLIDEDNAVLFGGYFQGSGYSSDVYVLHLPTVSWTCLPHEDEDHQPRPIGRRNLSAACLGYNSQHKTVLISGGLDTDNNVLSDTWLLDPQSGTFEEVHVSDKKLLQRQGHKAASFNINPECTEVIIIGGKQRFPGPNISDTVALRFELQSTQSSGTKSWILTDIADHTQLGSPKRLEEKRRLMDSSSKLDKLMVEPKENQ